MDVITIADLEVHYHIGVPDAERARPQRLLLTIELEHDFTDAAAADDLTKTVDYGSLSRRLLAFGEGRSWKLIETLGTEIADLILKEFKPAAVTVEVKKFIVPQARHVSVRLRRTKPSNPTQTAAERIANQIGGVPAGWRR